VGKVAILDESILPHRPYQSLPFDQMSHILDKKEQRLEQSRCEVDGFSIAEERSLSRIQFIGAESRGCEGKGIIIPRRNS
jgi:hypothetical protein